MEREKIRIAYIGEAVEDGTMNLNELSGALIALSNLAGDANRILNKDSSIIEVRLSADFERGSFEMTLEIVRNLAEQIKTFFAGSNYSLYEILGAIGLVSTLSGANLIEIYRWVKGRKVQKVEVVDKEKVRVTVGDESREISIGAWNIFTSRKTVKHLEGVLHPLKNEGVTDFEIRDFKSKKPIEKISRDEIEYFTQNPCEEMKVTSAKQTLLLKIISVSFEPNLKWRFDDGDTKFYAAMADENFLKRIENAEISFSKGDVIFAEIETKQFYDLEGLRKTEKTVIKVLTKD